MLTPDSSDQEEEVPQHPELPANLQLIEEQLQVEQIPPFIPQQPIAQIAPIIMAAQPQKKFCVPPTFFGKDDEDGVDWLQRYEDTGRYNSWGEPELLQNCGRYIEGACRKWFRCLTPAPTHWLDQA